MRIWKVYMMLDDHDIIGCDCFDSYEKAKESYIKLCESLESEDSAYTVKWNDDWKEIDSALSDEFGYFEIFIEDDVINPGFEE